MQARKILGLESKDVPDEVIASDVRIAELMKDLFFEEFRKIAKNEIDNIEVPR